jgi:murein tripeptide amidase MpaA
LIKSEVLTKSVEGRELFVVYFSKDGFGKDKSKIKVLIFAQQHGNEQSGKEGALLLVAELLKPENQYLFDKIDFALVPQMNPDGSEKNQRRNGNSLDLNRNHLILTEPETIGLHNLFNKYLFEVTMDVHEYAP